MWQWKVINIIHMATVLLYALHGTWWCETIISLDTKTDLSKDILQTNYSCMRHEIHDSYSSSNWTIL